MNLNILSGLLATGDGNALDTAVLSLDDAGLPADFAQLLSERFIPDNPGNGKSIAAQLRADDAGKPAISRQQLNQLLASLGDQSQLPSEPQALETLINSKLPSVKGDDDKPLLPTDTLDAATLQALFAMLPAPLAAPIAGSELATADGQSIEEAPLSTTSRLLSALSEPSERPVPLHPVQRTAVNAVDNKSAPTTKLDSTTTPSAQFAANADNDLAPLKLAAEAISPDPTVHHAVSAPISSPVATSAPVSATALAPTTPQLNAQLGSQEWQQALSQQVLLFHRNGQQSAELRLHPQELGSLQITLKLDDNQAQLHIASAQGQVRSAVEAALPHLRQALAENGINLGQSSVGGESLPQPQQSQQQASHNGGHPSYREQHGAGETGDDIVTAPTVLQAMARSVDGVDTFA